MWIMILMTTYFGDHQYKATTATPVVVTAIEFTSRENCINAANFMLKKKKVYSANCMPK